MELTDNPPSRAMSDAVPASNDTRPLQSPDIVAIENARGGRWEINDDFDGWMLIGANGRPVMRVDRTKVGFGFQNVARLAAEMGLTASTNGGKQTLDRPRPGLAMLDSGYDQDWTPQTRKSYWADITKSAKLLAYYYVRTTEPQEAVRRAVATLLNNPVPVHDDNVQAFVPGRYDVEVVKTVANYFFSELVRSETDEASSAASDKAVDNIGANDETSPQELAHTEDRGARPQGSMGAGNPEAEPIEGDRQRLNNVRPSHGNQQLDLDPTLREGIGPGTDPIAPSDSSKSNHPSAVAGGAGNASGLVTKLLEPLAKYGRAVTEQTVTIASGNFEADKLLAPAMAAREIVSTALNDPILGPSIEAFATLKGGIKTSLINRPLNRKDREVQWKLEAKTNPGNYKPADIERMKKGKPPIGSDGHPLERHHVDGTHEGGVKVMTRTDHRLGPNYQKNHPKRDKK